MLTNSFTEKCETWVTWELFMGFAVAPAIIRPGWRVFVC